MVLRAESIFPLSPPDDIQRTPPQMRKINAKMTARTSNILIMPPTILLDCSSRRLQRLLKLPPGQTSRAYVTPDCVKKTTSPKRATMYEANIFTLQS